MFESANYSIPSVTMRGMALMTRKSSIIDPYATIMNLVVTKLTPVNNVLLSSD